MFKTKTETDDHPLHHGGAVKVLQCDFRAGKMEEQLERWIAAGWTIKGTDAVLINGQTAFILVVLERKPRS